MRFSYVVTAVAALVAAASSVTGEPEASAAVGLEHGIEARATKSLGVFYCVGAIWTTKCWHRVNLKAGTFYEVGPSYNDKILSFGPDKGTRCTLCINGDCSLGNGGGFSEVIHYPGIRDMNDWWGRFWDYDHSWSGVYVSQNFWNGRISGFLCYPE
ncbi:hypothetical protein TWF225_007688 [Orbilia oligospora]|uniref:Uncharacterized protein n=1 Tax=Orbilia oligospora TaxID=2813651 RepID=A0A7C8P118_ORBOL|nr:hypothetical protein TWF751_001114 [Orbilia oligospora]KAF3179156.1 hypothetical protein TWF225_007688 [Orbilia oligospora]KAF3232582.1 hypothetical protein TWF128_003909 [Orbilia oligospora]KAF3246793.1 hypothetical protein TWF217_009816 [Orbilia oligospora]KAF3275117.1 hypothetical protein TWF132_003002 [Orbilia oligospora]